MKLNISKPIVFFDLETTGIDVTNDHIVEICYIKVFPNGNEESKSMRIRPADALGNTIHIPEQSSEVHGIYDEDVKDCPTFKEVATNLYETFRGSDLGGYNSNHFDIPLLVEEFLRAGINADFSKAKCVDVCVIYKKINPRTLTAAYKQYCHKNLEDAHSALADTRATLDVLEAMLDCPPEDFKEEIQNNIDKLAEFSVQNRNVDYAGRMIYNDQNEEIFNFGKYKGRKVTEVLKADPSYFAWMMQGDFAQNTKQVLTKIKLRESQSKNGPLFQQNL